MAASHTALGFLEPLLYVQVVRITVADKEVR